MSLSLLSSLGITRQVRLLPITHPQPDPAVALSGRVAFDFRRLGDVVLAGDMHAASAAIAGTPKQHDIHAADGAGEGVIGNLPRQLRGKN